jgi:hypothetical protein
MKIPTSSLPAALLAALFVQAAAAQQDAVVQLKDDPSRRIVLENSVVRIWEVNVPVGESTAFHEHSIDTASVRINATVLTNEPKGGGLFSFARDYSLDAGSVSYSGYSKEPYVHRITPKGPNPHRVIEFEILVPSGKSADAAERAGYTMLMDNSRIRASRLALDPGQSSDQVAPRKNTLVVVVKGGVALQQSNEEAPQTSELKPGDIQWHAAAGKRTLKNAGASQIDIVEVEVK